MTWGGIDTRKIRPVTDRLMAPPRLRDLTAQNGARAYAAALVIVGLTAVTIIWHTLVVQVVEIMTGSTP